MNPQPGLPGVLLLLAGALGLVSCQTETCPPFLCSSAIRLDGAQRVPEATTQIDVRFCSKEGCVAGTLDVAQSHESDCLGQPVGAFQGNVCATRKGRGELQLSASLVARNSEPIPPDGDEYTLEVVDAESNEVLVDREWAADYVPPSSDDCDQCWQATLKL